MKKISADLILPVEGSPIKNGIIIVDENGEIIDIQQEKKHQKSPEVTYYSGIIVPGFINTHNHLEYAYAKDLIDQGQKLPGFIKSIVQIKQEVPADYQMIEQADRDMYEWGTVAVGDQTNTLITKDVKAKSKIYYHSFIELYQAIGEINDSLTDFRHGQVYLTAFNNQGSIVPHAPYSVGPDLLKIIAYEAFMRRWPVSIHNQETESEADMFRYGKGDLYELFRSRKTPQPWIPTGTSSLQWYLPFFRDSHNLLLIHNTYTSKEDIYFAENTHKRLFWVMCPNSNLYIEKRLPDIPVFVENNCTICLGTDSYASNTSLNILEEMRTLQENFEIPFEKLLEWATINGARALNLDHIFGSITPGKRPGLVLLQNIDPDKKSLSPQVKIKRII